MDVTIGPRSKRRKIFFRNNKLHFPLIVAFSLLTGFVAIGGDIPAVRAQLYEQLLRQFPDKAAIRYQQALAYARVENSDRALQSLTLALHDRPWLDPTEDAGFLALRSNPSFRLLSRSVRERYPPVHSGRAELTVQCGGFVTEGIASDSDRRIFYIGDVVGRKILAVSPNGEVSQFIVTGQGGLLEVLGIKVDLGDHSVWAASELARRSVLCHFDASGRALVARESHHS